MPKSRILFVDDEPSIRITLPMILRQQGLEVTVASTVAEALGFIRTETFDALLSDLNIGEPGDGFTLVSAMRRTQPKACTFIITGFPDFDTALTAIRNQVDDYFVKPVQPNALLEGIRQHLNQERAPQASHKIKKVVDVIIENEDLLVRLWLEAVKADPELTLVTLKDSERVDHIPAILISVKEMLESTVELSEGAAKAARKHGEMRQRQGYTVPMLIVEARILQTRVTEILQENLLRIEISTLIPDIIRVGQSLNAQLEESVRAFEQNEVAA